MCMFGCLQGLTSLRTKGIGLAGVEGIPMLNNLKDLTLTLSESLSMGGWQDLAALTALTSLNINAWGDVVSRRKIFW